ncbi:MAG: hypothetical protein J4478_00800 [Candidatus Diapherotrites archaeon]|nr:hypothetical protein [Candidatus Diapherotrites archaeon]HIH21107.1 hypothetical protein [Candidatus Diapherotrites archaeon]
MRLSEFIAKLPFGKKVTVFYPYYREAKFFESIKGFPKDKATLAAAIRKAAHSLDKDLNAFEQFRLSGSEAYLEGMLQEWHKSNYAKDETITWAEQVLKKHKAERARKKVE